MLLDCYSSENSYHQGAKTFSFQVQFLSGRATLIWLLLQPGFSVKKSAQNHSKSAPHW